MAWLTESKLNERRRVAFLVRGQSITYRVRNKSFNKQTGAVTGSASDTEIPASTDDPGVLVGQLSQEFIDQSGGKFKYGDRQFKILTESMPSGITKPIKDEHSIVYRGEEFLVVDFFKSSDTNVWVINGSRING